MKSFSEGMFHSGEEGGTVVRSLTGTHSFSTNSNFDERSDEEGGLVMWMH